MLKFLRKSFAKETDVILPLERRSRIEFVSRHLILGVLVAFASVAFQIYFAVFWFAAYLTCTLLSTAAINHFDRDRSFRNYLLMLLTFASRMIVYRSFIVFLWLHPDPTAKFPAMCMLVAAILHSITQRSKMSAYAYIDGTGDFLILAFFASYFIFFEPSSASSLISTFSAIGVMIYHVVSLRDVHLANKELARIEERSRESQKMEAVGRLTGGVAHDFNNILTVVMGNLDLYREVDDAKEKDALALKAHEAAERASTLTAQLLAFSRQSPLMSEQIKTAEFLKKLHDMTTRVLPATIEFQSHAHDGIWDIEADRNQLDNALLNLVINARDAMNSGGLLTLSAKNHLQTEKSDNQTEAGPYVCIELADQGHGIPAEVIDKVFEPFFTTKPVGKGSGLGLSMVKGFVEQSGGILNIESDADTGTTISFTLPARP